jgi:ribosome-binding protein aMBF1 (putative translation factor)
MPTIHSVQKVSSLPKTKVSGYMREEKPMASSVIGRKLDKAMSGLVQSTPHDDTHAVLEDLLHVASSNGRFDSREQFAKFLSEGILLNINRLISTSIGVPQGEYVIYKITPEKAMLVPVEQITVQETFSGKPETYEIHTQSLLGCWNKVERVLAEAGEDTAFRGSNPGPQMSGGEKERIQRSKSKYPRRTEVKSALEKHGNSQEDVADSLGVHPSTVSRWTADDEKGGRVPNLADAIGLEKALGTPVSAMFPDVQPSKTKHRKATSGSGGGRNKTYKRGNA